MGTVFKKSATKPLPAGARVFVRKGQRLAEWADAKGKRRTAPVTTGKDGADDSAPRQFAPEFAPTVGKPVTPGSIRDKQARWEDPNSAAQETQEPPEKQGFSAGFLQWAMTGSNCRPPRCKRGALTN